MIVAFPLFFIDKLWHFMIIMTGMTLIPGSAANCCSCGLFDYWLLYRSAAVVSCYHIWRTTMPATNPILNPRDLPYCVNCYMFTIMFVGLAMLVGQGDCWVHSFAFDLFFSVHSLPSHIKIRAHQPPIDWMEINSLPVVVIGWRRQDIGRTLPWGQQRR